MSFFFSETVYRLGLCNHLGNNRGAEREMLSKCSLTMIIVNKASVGPVLNHTHVVMHLESPDSPTPGHALGTLTAV